ncbi:MAG: HAD family phosphatase [Phocaeicola sp.]|nr:HAD family phosphatase [Phocaeicola sp.]
MSKVLRNIVFDFGGVLVDLDFKRSFNAFRSAGFFDIEERMSAVKRDQIFDLYETGEISTSRFRNEIRKHLSYSLFDKDVDYMWNEMLVGIPPYKLDLILHLKKHYHIYLLSNTNELHWNYACDCLFKYKRHTVKDFFIKPYLSYEMHKVKPDAPIYEEMLSDAGLEAEETLFIDDLEVNCKGAASVGIQAQRYRIGTNLSELIDW